MEREVIKFGEAIFEYSFCILFKIDQQLISIHASAVIFM